MAKIFLGQDKQAVAVEIGVSELSQGIANSLPVIAGNIYHVKPYTGSDTLNNGLSVESAFKTLAKALATATASQNDIVIFHGEGNASASCTDYQSVMLDWNKDMVHLIGSNNGVTINPRSRIANISTWTSANPTIKLSAAGCLIRGMSIWSGCTDTTTKGALWVDGMRNRIEQCHIIGMGTAANDVAGGYSLLLSGAENEFVRCTIGAEIVALGASVNSQILVAARSTVGAFGNKFIDCDIVLNSAHATNTVFYRVPTTTMAGSLSFIRCRGRNGAASPGPLTYAGVTHASAGGNVYVDAESSFQATDLDSSTTNVYVVTLGANSTSGLWVPRA